MAKRIEHDQNRASYHTFDDRLVSRDTIESAINQVEARQRRRELMERARTWLVLALVVCVVATVTVLLWSHFL
ncbi:MAG TPA: hypothetical protein VF898_10385 [Chloroflexota bacterium]